MTDLDEYLARTEPVDADELLELVCDDQVARWTRGQRIPAEAYLRRYAVLEQDPEAAFAIVYGEFALRREMGEVPSLEEFRWRFPQFAERLYRQMLLHSVLRGHDASVESTRSPANDKTPNLGEAGSRSGE